MQLTLGRAKVRLAPAYEVNAAGDVGGLICCRLFSPPAPSLTLTGYAQQWTIGFASAAERDIWSTRLADAIDLSHGEESPYHEWSLGATLGTGTFATVRIATHRASGRRCACKVLSRSFMANQGREAAEYFEREVMVMRHVSAAVDSAGLVRLLHVAEYGDMRLLFLSPLANGTLLQLVASRGVLSDAQAATAARALLTGMAALHATGIAHLDIKPQNLLYCQPATSGGRVTFDAHGEPADLIISDMGCARFIITSDTGDGATKSTNEGAAQTLQNDGGGTLYFTVKRSRWRVRIVSSRFCRVIRILGILGMANL